MNKSRSLIAIAASLGLGNGHVNSLSAQVRPSEQRILAAVKNGMAANEIREDALGFDIGGGAFRNPGCPPKEWGMSHACWKMVRKSRLHAKGISHAKI
jgi:hypothetical protein